MSPKREQIKKYFQPFPQWTIWVILIGVLLLIYVVGIIFIGIGIWGIKSWSDKPTDKQIDKYINEDLEDLEARALVKTGLDKSELIRESVKIIGPRFWNIGGAEIGFKKGKDDIIRFMPLGVTIINFTADQLVTYQCVIDLTTGKALSESTNEYFYTDVVSVETSTKSSTFRITEISPKLFSIFPEFKNLIEDKKLQLNESETFILTTSGGTSVEVILEDPALIKNAGGGIIPTGYAEQAIQAVRQMLREKRRSR